MFLLDVYDFLEDTTDLLSDNQNKEISWHIGCLEPTDVIRIKITLDNFTLKPNDEIRI